jgi:hypothetical protein
VQSRDSRRCFAEVPETLVFLSGAKSFIYPHRQPARPTVDFSFRKAFLSEDSGQSFRVRLILAEQAVARDDRVAIVPDRL